MGAQKSRLIGTVLLSTHNIFFLVEKEDNYFSVLTKGLLQHILGLVTLFTLSSSDV